VKTTRNENHRTHRIHRKGWKPFPAWIRFCVFRVLCG
jgi:hypothetical protein